MDTIRAFWNGLGGTPCLGRKVDRRVVITVSRGAILWRDVVGSLFVFPMGVIGFKFTGTIRIRRGMFVVVMSMVRRFSVIVMMTWVVV